MLLRFWVKNFKSFAGEAALHMAAAQGGGRSGVIGPEGAPVLPVAAIYGANASGKSNLLDALRRMWEVVRGDARAGTPFLMDGGDAAVEFEVSIAAGELEYRYGFGLAGRDVREEWLFCRPFGKGGLEKQLYYRDEDGVSVESTFSASGKKMLQYCAEMAAGDELLLHALARRDVPAAMDVYGFFQNMLCLDFTEEGICGGLKDFTGRALFEDAALRRDMARHISSFDCDINGIRVKAEEDREGEKHYRVYTVHEVHGKKKEFPLEFESDGTVKLIGLMTCILLCMRRGGVLVCDEMDIKIHPLVLRRIVSLYHDGRVNKKNAQIVFSAHNIVYLDSRDLRRDEIWFVEKKGGKSELYSLYDVKMAAKKDTEFGRDYLAGRFGAVPFGEECE